MSSETDSEKRSLKSNRFLWFEQRHAKKCLQGLDNISKFYALQLSSRRKGKKTTFVTKIFTVL